MHPPLTIGLPVYNGEKFLADALASLAAQSFGDYRLYISDNASTDSTEAICREFVETDGRIEYARQEANMGGAWNFNHVATEAQSPFFKWMTHDDLMEPTLIERCIDAMDDAPDDTILTYPRTVLIDENGVPIRDFEDQLDLRMADPHARLRAYLDNYEMSNAIFGVIRHPMLMHTGLLGTYDSSDKVLLAEMAMLGRFWEIPERLFLRRYHEGMSRQANVTPEEVAAWFDPNQPRPIKMTRTKLFVEYARSIGGGDLQLSPSERARCLQELVASGGVHEMRVMGGEMKRELKISVGRLRRRLTPTS